MANLDQKRQEYSKAARLRYEKGLEYSEIAEEFNYKPQTIRRWFSEGKIEEVKRKFSDEELFKLQRTIEQDIWDAEQEAKSLLSKAQSRAEKPKEMRQIAESMLNLRKRKIDLLQELGVIQKPKERKEVEQKSTDVTISEGVVDPSNLSDEVRERLEAEE